MTDNTQYLQLHGRQLLAHGYQIIPIRAIKAALSTALIFWMVELLSAIPEVLKLVLKGVLCALFFGLAFFVAVDLSKKEEGE